MMKSVGKGLLGEITKAGPVLTALAAPQPRMMAGSVKSFGDQLQQEVAEVKDIREKIANGEMIVELDPAVLDISFVSDRIDNDEDEAFTSLLDGIRESGQQIPILVRPAAAGRYQIAFGHRRVRVAKALGVKVKAVIRSISDEQLIIAQGQENNARKDLSFIEKALFAWRLESSGVKRSVITAALAVSKSHLSDHMAIVQKITPDIILKIGAAPSVGRPRWQALANVMKDARVLERAAKIVASPEYEKASDRIGFIIQRLAVKPAASSLSELTTSAGVLLAHIIRRRSGSSITVKSQRFSAYLEARMPELISHFEAQSSEGRESQVAGAPLRTHQSQRGD
jgi:ParB family chromosome partitioning protein